MSDKVNCPYQVYVACIYIYDACILSLSLEFRFSTSSIGSCECGTCLRLLVFLTFRFDVEIFLQFSEENSIDENIVVVFLII
jgi:hypothetical protein